MLDSFFISAVQIIIESLPISSSAHVIVAQHLWLKITGSPLTEGPGYFDDFLQGPTILVLMVVFFKDWYLSVRRLFVAFWKFVLRQRLSWSERQLWSVFGTLIFFVCAADLMTAFAYGIKSFVGKSVFGAPPLWVLLINFTVSMVGLLSLKFMSKEQQYSRLSLKKAIILGTTQGLALLCPGLSRFGSTYVVGRWLNLSPRRAFQFSFLIQFPLILAAFMLKGLPGVFKASCSLISVPLLITLGVSTVIAGLLFAWAYRLARAGKLWWFGVYMLVPITILLFLIMGC